MNVPENAFFHIHTFRCGHAAMVPDEAYVRKAIELHAGSIWFSDHAPFPGDPLHHMMSVTELDGYLETIHALKHRYAGQIDVHAGLEIEYFPSFDRSGWYRQLKDDERIEFLMIGQHMAEIKPGHFSFEWDKERLARDEYRVLGEAVIAGIESGYFDFVAHPDRSFRAKRAWDDDMTALSRRIIGAAAKADIPLEKNKLSARMAYNFWPEFWRLLTPANRVITGLDAHSVEDMAERAFAGLPEIYS